MEDVIRCEPDHSRFAENPPKPIKLTGGINQISDRAGLKGRIGGLQGGRILLCGVVLLPSVLLFCLYVSRQPGFLAIQMNADSLLPASLIWDLYHHEHVWHGFQLPRIPSLFPDLLIQTVVSALSGHGGWSIFWYNYIQLSMFVFAAGYLAHLMTGRSLLLTMSLSMMTIVIIVFSDMLLPGTTGITTNYFVAANHFGPFVTSLLASALAVNLMQRWRTDTAVLFFVISALSILSDKLVLVSFAFPVILAAAVTCFIYRSTVKSAWKLAGVVVASIITASALETRLNRQPDVSIELDQVVLRLSDFFIETSTYIREHVLVVSVCLLIPFAIFLVWPLLSVAGRATAPVVKRQTSLTTAVIGRAGEINLPVLFLWIHAALGMLGVTAATALLAYVDYGSYRYLAPVLSWSIIFLIAAVCERAALRWLVCGVGSASLLTAAVDLARQGDFRPGTVAWRSPIADCLQAEKERLGLKSGLAEYWISRPVMFASKWSLQVNQATSDGRPYIWGNNRDWYIRSFGRSDSQVLYNFIVMDRLDPVRIASRFGQPSEIHQCRGGHQVWVYDDSERLTEEFLKDFPLHRRSRGFNAPT